MKKSILHCHRDVEEHQEYLTFRRKVPRFAEREKERERIISERCILSKAENATHVF